MSTTHATPAIGDPIPHKAKRGHRRGDFGHECYICGRTYRHGDTETYVAVDQATDCFRVAPGGMSTDTGHSVSVGAECARRRVPAESILGTNIVQH